MTELAYWEARSRAVCRELDANPDLVVLGGYLSLPFNPDDGLIERYPDRVLGPPISEFATAGLAVGAAMEGIRALVTLGTSSFMFYAWSPIVNEAPHVRYLSAGQVTAPVVFHIHAGARRHGGVQHEHTPQAMLQNVPGLRLFAPSTPADVDAAFHAALTGDDPVVIVDHVLLSDVRGHVPANPRPFTEAEWLRRGHDVLLVSYSLMTQRCLDAAEELSRRGIDAGVFNVRVLAPLPLGALTAAAARSEVLLFVDESRAAGSPASFMMARILEAMPGKRARLVCSLDAPSPFAAQLLDHVTPTTGRIVAEALDLLTKT